jgi:dermatan 4-sulfotransferase 1
MHDEATPNDRVDLPPELDNHAARARGSWSLRERWSDRLKSMRLARRPFYRACGFGRRSHPVVRHHAVALIDGRILISHEARYLFVRVPKCANSTILGTLAHAEQAAHGVDLPDDTSKKRELARAFDRPSALDTRVAHEVLGEYRHCMFVRNPFSRVASGYLHKMVAGDYAKRTGLPAKLSFRGFCEHLAAGGAWGDIHWLPQADICPIAPGRLHFIGHFEHLADDLERMARLLYGQPAALVTRDHHATGADSRLQELYCRHTRALVRDIYRRDFEAFGYDPEKLPE